MNNLKNNQNEKFNFKRICPPTRTYNKYFVISFLVVLVLALFTTSCTKEKSLFDEIQDQKITEANVLISDIKYENGYLVFKDKEHYTDVLNWLATEEFFEEDLFDKFHDFKSNNDLLTATYKYLDVQDENIDPSYFDSDDFTKCLKFVLDKDEEKVTKPLIANNLVRLIVNYDGLVKVGEELLEFSDTKVKYYKNSFNPQNLIEIKNISQRSLNRSNLFTECFAKYEKKRRLNGELRVVYDGYSWSVQLDAYHHKKVWYGWKTDPTSRKFDITGQYSVDADDTGITGANVNKVKSHGVSSRHIEYNASETRVNPTVDIIGNMVYKIYSASNPSQVEKQCAFID